MKEFRVASELASARRTNRHAAVFAFLLAAVVFGTSALPRPAAAQPVKGEVTAITENGFTRLVFTLAEDVESQVTVGGGIIIIGFQRPVDVVLDRLATSAGGLVSAARRDPDGKAIRIALARRVTVNSLAAAERLFVDLLPETWSGLPPGLPREVIEELSRRARESDKKLRQQRALVRQQNLAQIRVRVANQPDFTRYVFELPGLIAVAANNGKDRLTLTFDAPLRFDLADAKATLPGVIGAIDTELNQESALVRFLFTEKVDVRTFREDSSFMVDVTPMDAKGRQQKRTAKLDELSVIAAELSARASAPPAQPPTTVRTPRLAAADEVRTPAPPRRAEEPAAPHREAAPAAAPAAPAPVVAERARAAEPEIAKAPRVTIVNAAVKRNGDNLSLEFPFASATPAAVFTRGDTLWLVFDTDAKVVVAGLEDEPSRTIKNAAVTRGDDHSLVRIKLARPRLVSAAPDGSAWIVTLGSEVVEPTRPVVISRNIVGAARSSVTIPFDDPRRLHRLADPEAGDTLMIVTALGPTRGFVKNQDFVEFRALASTQGVVVQPISDDLGAELAFDKIVITRPAGLTLSAAANAAAGRAGAGTSVAYQPHVIDLLAWSSDRNADFKERNSQLIRFAAEAPEGKRPVARADLARFYLAREMGVEAKAVLDLLLADGPLTAEDPTPLILRAIANIAMGRLDQALKDLGHPLVGNQHDAPLWRALIYARQGKWNEAREGFNAAGMVMRTLPLELQRSMLKDMVRASIEVGDITRAVEQMQEFVAVGVPRELEATVSVLSGRLAEALGRTSDALRAYQTAADSWDRPAAAQGRLRDIVLRYSLGRLQRGEVVAALETLTTVWRGDETEVEALQLLAHIYAEENRYRDAFQIMRTTVAVHPNSGVTRRIHDEAVATFDSVFLGGKGDALPAVGALSLFYDFRDLTPIGRRGDEMIRRLADRLVSVDLLRQAAELLQHQVDNRLQGAARAQVATRLAAVYLMNRKPDRALAVLRTTRSADLSSDLRNQRLLLEARALSDLGRNDVALEVAANIPGRETIRLRADILWAAQRWRDSAEQIELFHDDRWRDFAPLSESERRDILRAGIGYVLGEDVIGIERLRERYAAKIEDGPDRRAFDVVTAPLGASGAEFREIARRIAAVDTLEAFLRDLRARYPGPPGTAQVLQSDPPTTGSSGPRGPNGERAADRADPPHPPDRR